MNFNPNSPVTFFIKRVRNFKKAKRNENLIFLKNKLGFTPHEVAILKFQDPVFLKEKYDLYEKNFIDSYKAKSHLKAQSMIDNVGISFEKFLSRLS